MRRWLIIFTIVFVFVFRFRDLQSIWTKNLGDRQLWPVWAEQQAHRLNPPCQKVADFSDLEQSLRARLVVEPDDRNAMTHLGRTLWLEGDCQEAVAVWEEASLRQDSNASRELFRVGQLAALSPETRLSFSNEAFDVAAKLKTAGEDASAGEWYRRAFELDPGRKAAGYLIEMHEKAGDTAAVKHMWGELVKELPAENPEHWWAQAELLVLQEQWEAAALAYSRGAELCDNSFDYWMQAGGAWEKAREWGQAGTAFHNAHVAQPEDMWPALGVARSLRYQERHKEAWAWYSAARELAPGRFEPYYYLGEYAYYRQDYSAARANLEAALAIRSDHAWSLYYLAQVAHQDGDLRAAEGRLLKAITSYEPEPPDAWWTLLGEWRLERGDCTGAGEAYQAADPVWVMEDTIRKKLDLLRQLCGEEVR